MFSFVACNNAKLLQMSEALGNKVDRRFHFNKNSGRILHICSWTEMLGNWDYYNYY